MQRHNANAKFIQQVGLKSCYLFITKFSCFIQNQNCSYLVLKR